MAGPNVGLSSKALLCFALGIENDSPFGRHSHPHDPDDLNRCLLMLDQFPEVRAWLPNAAGMNKHWARLVMHWPALERSFYGEAGRNWAKARAAPETYALMQRVLEGKA